MCATIARQCQACICVPEPSAFSGSIVFAFIFHLIEGELCRRRPEATFFRKCAKSMGCASDSYYVFDMHPNAARSRCVQLLPDNAKRAFACQNLVLFRAASFFLSFFT